MKLEEAKALKSALGAGIAQAEASGSDDVQLQAQLSTLLGGALSDLEAAIAQAKQS